MSDPIRDKAFSFALRIVKLADHLQKEHREFTLSKKVLDSGVNIGLFIEEARQGESRSEFQQKYSIANKEAFKTNYLLKLIEGGGYINSMTSQSFLSDCEELQRMLISAIKTTRHSAL